MPGPAEPPNDVDNHLMLNWYFINPGRSTDTWRRDFANRFHGWRSRAGEISRFFCRRGVKMRFAGVSFAVL
jgi:hypothetical protein